MVADATPEKPLILRCDDVTAQTNPNFIASLYEQALIKAPGLIPMVAIAIHSKMNSNGSVYPNPPFKDEEPNFFMDVDMTFNGLKNYRGFKIASHGLFHFDHTYVKNIGNIEVIRWSIITSCRLLRTKIFIPPFNRWDSNVEDICNKNGLYLVKMEEGWKSLEYNDFDPDHKLWYFHHWKYKTVDEFRAKLGIIEEKKSDDPRDDPKWWEPETDPITKGVTEK